MMAYDLTLRAILQRSTKLFSKKEIITRDYSGTFRYTYSEFYKRAQRLANVLKNFSIAKGDRVATLAWNHHRHLELYFAVPVSGAVLHTLNLRLAPEQLVYIINHAEDKIIFVDKDLVPLLESIQDQLPTLEYIVVMSDTKEIPSNTLINPFSYETLLAEASENFEFPDLSEWDPAAMCYTTATTGKPKGVVYTHRALVLHSYAASLPDSLNLQESDRVMPFVPMFHANAWGLPFACTWLGSTQVFPGARPQAEDICQLIQDHKVTLAAGVPTIWMATYPLWESGKYDPSSLREIVNGGSAAPISMIKNYLEKLGVSILHAYGMTETTPVVLVSRLKSSLIDISTEEKLKLSAKQGLLVPGLEMRVIGEDGNEVPWNGQTMGELLVRGPWIAKEYYKDPIRTKEAFYQGWLRTGDIVTVDSEGYVSVADRSKDLIKSGGEWISSLDLENTIMGHPSVLEAAVIAIPHPKWVERPLACVVLKQDYVDKINEQDILDYLKGKAPKIWVPDRVEFIDAIPRTSVGKFFKAALRSRFAKATNTD
ncbi:acyl-CoA synthetase (AMP-forming)/AMP-acid ligase II [Desulfosporosinus orientis DSM 765]|uniref:Acyl-CoA synthetase (AMP-forming)/AMP-acid ligase II n=1 Tax=Desulfosporosinus orientis (strain ATCC 19365 / DSM 765 / NCIMB 8382 / VKM B-1628 / Singapore I) TaxID=768706 RepID=G7WE06_DESOD|nr:long-chain fatty acid--CoA ligase [Desulfosporosinus orientis]AET69404.1 acyl-CoA synthetase (AMP-forming)/AMP-acid ligase II [Desulfosporosinus orientis DSM 765]